MARIGAVVEDRIGAVAAVVVAKAMVEEDMEAMVDVERALVEARVAWVWVAAAKAASEVVVVKEADMAAIGVAVAFGNQCSIP